MEESIVYRFAKALAYDGCYKGISNVKRTLVTRIEARFKTSDDRKVYAIIDGMKRVADIFGLVHVKSEWCVTGEMRLTFEHHEIKSDTTPLCPSRSAPADDESEPMREALENLLDGLDANCDGRDGLSEEEWDKRIAKARAVLEETQEQPNAVA